MPADKLTEAIALIKAGDKQNGQRLLTEFLKQDPDNENAWLWMGSLVTGDKRRFCLEKVLSINPNNILALQQMEKYTSLPAAKPQSPQKHQETPVRKPTDPPLSLRDAIMQEPVGAPSALSSAPESISMSMSMGDQHWLTPGKHLSTIVYFSGGTLLAFDVLPDIAMQVFNEVRSGVSPKQLYEDRRKYHLQSVCYVPFSRITTVKLFSEDITVISSGEKKNTITCNKENATAILDAIQARLDSRFKRTTQPISRVRVMASGAIGSTVILCITGFFYWFIQGLAADGGVTSGSRRARGLSNLLLLIGPNGALCIGSILLLIVLIGFFSSMAKPPEETILSRT